MAGFTAKIPVRFGDEDHARIVYFPRFLHFFHCAFEDFFAHHGVPYRECLETDKTGWPAVKVETDFHSPLRFGDVFEVDVGVAKLGSKSASFAYRGHIGERLVATATITVVCVDMDDFKAKPIPEKYRKIFEGALVTPE